ncbi:MAG TPA: glycosyltransferase family 39 protein [Candidatus Paceibacterota bacterium]
MKAKILVPGIIILASILSYFSAWNDAPIVDEIPHIGAGYSYVSKGDYRLNPEHPPLAKLVAGLAIAKLPFSQNIFQGPIWEKNINDQWYFGRNLLFHSGVDAQTVVRIAKAPMLIFFILSALIIYLWSRELFGKRAGLIALFLFSFSPTVLAHSRLVTTDMAALFGVLLASYAFTKFLNHPSKKYVFLAGLALGTALLTKFSTFILAPFFFVVALATKSISTIGKAVIVSIVAVVFVIWPIYAFLVQGYPMERQRNDATHILETFGNGLVKNVIIADSGIPLLRPIAQYGLGLAMVAQRSAGGNTAFFFGHNYYLGLKKYFPIVYLIKEPLAFWGLVVLSIIGFLGFRQKTEPRSKFYTYSIMILAGWLILYWLTSITSRLNIGVRHLLPAYGATYILLAGGIERFFQSSKKKAWAVGILCFWYFAEAIISFPHYLQYMNQAVGGPGKGYQVVADSNLDWGQDLKRLADWAVENDIPLIYLDYFGWADQAYYLKDRFKWLTAGTYLSKEDFLKINPQGGYIAVSATFLTQANADNADPLKNYRWLENEKPIAVIGYSIFVWQIKP